MWKGALSHIEMNVTASVISNISHRENCLLSDDQEVVDTLKYLLFSVIFLTSLCGNGFVCWVVWRRLHIRTVMNYFLLNLAVDDLAFTVICIPFDLPVQLNQCIWPYFKAFCKVLFPMQTICALVSAFTLTAIGISRYRAIVHPMKTQLGLAASKRFILCIWIISFVLVIPYALVLEVDPTTKQCSEVWPEPRHTNSRVYSYFMFIAGFALPLTVLLCSYLKISCELRKNATPNANCVLQADHAREAEKVLKLSIAVTVVFAICTLPNHVVWLALDFDGINCAQCNTWLTVANTLVFANSAANPVVFVIFNENYRNEIRSILKCKRKRHQRERKEQL